VSAAESLDEKLPEGLCGCEKHLEYDIDICTSFGGDMIGQLTSIKQGGVVEEAS